MRKLTSIDPAWAPLGTSEALVRIALAMNSGSKLPGSIVAVYDGQMRSSASDVHLHRAPAPNGAVSTKTAEQGKLEIAMPSAFVVAAWSEAKAVIRRPVGQVVP